MTPTSLVAISGSPSARSRTALLTAHVLDRLAGAGLTAEHVRVRELPPAPLLAVRTEEPALRRALDAVAAADGVVIASPVYQTAYSGLLKAFLDLLPQAGLAGKTVLPLMTGGTLAHALALDYALRPVLTALGARQVLRGAFVLDQSITRGDDGPPRLAPDAEDRLARAVEEFTTALLPDGRLVVG
ncbi:NADPH-dependent FMN reductase [Streptomyces sp. NPDC051132]|uniref:NADPH-dependent FMN reductase n=1 Tax=unclassified Streptomyces TaxID=2593676 RepID=UPI003412A73C